MPLEPVPYDKTAHYRFVRFIADLIEKPVIWFRENVVVPNREEYPWYHEQMRRVPTIDECYSNDAICMYEADMQYKRDKLVEYNILQILKRRAVNCNMHNKPDHVEVCTPLIDQWQRAQTNYFIKYGEMICSRGAKEAYMKQKHRMIWERRHGPVGSGMRTQESETRHTQNKKTKEC